MTVFVDTHREPPQRRRFVSLQVRLLVGFTIIFTGVFSAAYYWFYTFTIESAVASLRKDLNNTLEGAAAGVDAEELIDLYTTGEPNAAGFSDDPRYLNQISWFETIQQLEPRAWPYAYIMVGLADQDTARKQVRDSNGNISVETFVPSHDRQLVGVVDLWAIHDPAKSYLFLDMGEASHYSVRAWKENRLIERSDLYADAWGEWFSSYTPIRNAEGEVVALLGIDFEASYVNQLKRSLVDQIIISFSLAYITLFILVYVSSKFFTRPLKHLSFAAKKIANAEYDDTESFKLLSSRKLRDEFTDLSDTFMMMTAKIRGREEALKTRVQKLQIEIDETRKPDCLTHLYAASQGGS
ncbi:hypothetical protein GFS31_23450 [Leptolyngbya sp. BL0902]|uniref:HAMP domain-containing protein n=1 Tax=Leptolyngbya sp. BL0902 TaxID=1115757 RepID=UPI0018E6DC1D|nr:hypothetical protein [Leptolyngbya sp. BL0902]QQE65657.1 hypothetical protein GFS31_23450 [Leptolyngbya sp. BL0902]